MKCHFSKVSDRIVLGYATGMADNNDQELTRQEKKSWKVLGKYSTLSPAGVASQGLMLYHTN